MKINYIQGLRESLHEYKALESTLKEFQMTTPFNSFTHLLSDTVKYDEKKLGGHCYYLAREFANLVQQKLSLQTKVIQAVDAVHYAVTVENTFFIDPFIPGLGVLPLDELQSAYPSGVHKTVPSLSGKSDWLIAFRRGLLDTSELSIVGIQIKSKHQQQFAYCYNIHSNVSAAEEDEHIALYLGDRFQLRIVHLVDSALTGMRIMHNSVEQTQIYMSGEKFAVNSKELWTKKASDLVREVTRCSLDEILDMMSDAEKEYDKKYKATGSDYP